MLALCSGMRYDQWLRIILENDSMWEVWGRLKRKREIFFFFFNCSFLELMRRQTCLFSAEPSSRVAHFLILLQGWHFPVQSRFLFYLLSVSYSPEQPSLIPSLNTPEQSLQENKTKIATVFTFLHYKLRLLFYQNL